MPTLQEPLLVSVSGPDRPGILARLAAILAESGIELVDLEQATLQGFLALTLLVDLRGQEGASRKILGRLLPAAREMGLQVEVRPPDREELRRRRERDLWAITLLGREETAATVAAVAGACAGHGANIVAIRRLAEADIRAAELLVDASRVQEVAAFRRDLLAAAETAGADLALAREDVYRRSKRLVVLDADSTLVAGEVIDALAEAAGVGEEVAALTDAAMAGDLDFETSLRRRVALLKGLPARVLDQVADAMALTPGAEETVAACKAMGLKVAVISGGFEFFTERLRRRLGLDYAFANRLEMVDGRLTGRLVGEIVDAQAKARLLEEIAAAERIHRSQVVGVGDGANDIPMLQRAGLGVAFRAREATRRVADAAIQQDNLKALLYLLGVSFDDLARLQGGS